MLLVRKQHRLNYMALRYLLIKGSLLSTNLVQLHNPTSIVVFGAGKQIEAHLDLHIRFFPSIKVCTIVNRTYNSRLESLQRLMNSRHPTVLFQCVASATQTDSQPEEKIKQALLSTTLVICATSSTSPLFPSAWVRAGTHVILIGSYTPSMHEVDGELIRRAIHQEGNKGVRQLLLVDSREACAIEAGELVGAAVDNSQMTEIGELVTVSESGELKFSSLFPGLEPLGADTAHKNSADLAEDNDEGVRGPITLFKSVGVGLQDVAIACAVVAKAEEMAIGTRIADYDI